MGQESGSWGKLGKGTRAYTAPATVLVADATNHVTTTTIDADEVMLHARGCAVRVAIDVAPDTTVAYNFILEAGERFHVKLLRSTHKVAATRDGSVTGSLLVTPISGA